MNLSHIRTVEIQSDEVFIDVNDLLIELMLDIEKCTSEAEKKVYRDFVVKITALRSRGHARKSI